MPSMETVYNYCAHNNLEKSVPIDVGDGYILNVVLLDPLNVLKINGNLESVHIKSATKIKSKVTDRKVGNIKFVIASENFKKVLKMLNFTDTFIKFCIILPR